MNIQEALSLGKEELKHSSTISLDAELILSQILKYNRADLISQSKKEISPNDESLYKSFIQERANGKPIAYIIQEKEFFGRSFFVDKRVMIPRPETEMMVEDAIELICSEPEPGTIIDLGTGSGAIGITMALELPDHQVIGLDISAKTLEVATINHKTHPCENLTLIESDLLSGLPKSLNNKPLTILANLPYIGTESNNFVSNETDRYEPHLALYGGPDGLDLYRRTWKQIKAKKLKISALLMEIGFSQAEIIEKECREAFPDYHFEIKEDLAGLARTAVLSTPNRQP